MQRRILSTCVVLLALTELSFSDEGQNRDADWLKKLDADEDGRISKKEYIDTWNLNFGNQDKNENNHLDFTEWNGGVKQKTASVSGRVFARKAFGRWDKDADGQISQAEYATYRGAIFDASDTNEDGYWAPLDKKSSQPKPNQ